MSTPTPTSDSWKVQRISGFTLSHPYAAHNPACPEGPHPTRSCGCRVFRSIEEAHAYIAERTACPPDHQCTWRTA